MHEVRRALRTEQRLQARARPLARDPQRPAARTQLAAGRESRVELPAVRGPRTVVDPLQRRHLRIAETRVGLRAGTPQRRGLEAARRRVVDDTVRHAVARVYAATTAVAIAGILRAGTCPAGSRNRCADSTRTPAPLA